MVRPPAEEAMEKAVMPMARRLLRRTGMALALAVVGVLADGRAVARGLAAFYLRSRREPPSSHGGPADVRNAAIRPGRCRTAGTPEIRAFGDSLIAGYGLDPSQSFAGRLEALLREELAGARVVNAGLCGDTTSTALARLPLTLGLLEAKPDLAIVQLGANDLIEGVALERIRANLDTIIAAFTRTGIPVLLARIRAPALFGAYGWACAAVYADLTRRHRIRSAPFFPRGVFANPAYCLADRMHPNARGTAEIARAFLPEVLSALGRPAARAPAGPFPLRRRGL
jgi:acyl-CoA thioesterase-1